MSLCSGERFNRYTIEGVLGRGGMGVVYRAHDPRLHRHVALKLLQPEWLPVLGSTLARSVRVLREARAAASLDHPNAVSIFDVGEEDGQPFIAMELIVGKPLSAFVGDQSIPLQRRVRWLLDIARVLAAAHKRGLAHRDVKPENVMVRDDDVIKVLDFGIARESVVTAPGEPAVSLAEALAPLVTRGGEIEGTFLYMAPEQMRGDPADCRSDQFGWGVVAYELLTGVTPWTWTGSPASLLAQMMRETPLLWSAAPDLPLPARDVVQRAVAASKEERFESMDRIVAALSPLAMYAVDSPVSAPPISMPAPRHLPEGGLSLSVSLGKRIGRQRLATIVAACALAAVTTAIGWHLAPARAERVALADAPSVSSAAPISPVPEAVQAFEEGMRAYENSAVELAIGAFERAVGLDPNLAAAHLRLGLYYEWRLARCADARASFERANAGRDRLCEHDRLILDAMPLYLEKDPPDVEEIHRRLEIALERFPNDPELLLLQTMLYQGSGDAPRLLRSAEQLVPFTPPFAPDARNFQGVGLMLHGQYDKALSMFEECASTSATDTCMRHMSSIHARRGECEKAEAVARRKIALTPSSPFGYEWLARTLSGQELSPDAVLEALRQNWGRLSPTVRERVELADKARVALWQGDFKAAILHAARLESIVGPEQRDHAEAVQLLVDALVEEGKNADAAKAAQRFLARQDGWIAQPWRSLGTRVDMTPRLLEVELHAGALRPSDFETARAQWAKRWGARAPSLMRNRVWFYAHGALVRTKDEANFALAAKTAYEPLPSYRDLRENAALGQTYYLAGKTTEAIEPLKSATLWCDALSEPVTQTRAFATLGRALEASGDTSGACEAYGRVLARWGAARPRSVTAEEVRKRVQVLGCR